MLDIFNTLQEPGINIRREKFDTIKFEFFTEFQYLTPWEMKDFIAGGVTPAEVTDRLIGRIPPLREEDRQKLIFLIERNVELAGRALAFAKGKADLNPNRRGSLANQICLQICHDLALATCPDIGEGPTKKPVKEPKQEVSLPLTIWQLQDDQPDFDEAMQIEKGAYEYLNRILMEEFTRLNRTEVVQLIKGERLKETTDLLVEKLPCLHEQEYCENTRIVRTEIARWLAVLEEKPKRPADVDMKNKDGVAYEVFKMLCAHIAMATSLSVVERHFEDFLRGHKPYHP